MRLPIALLALVCCWPAGQAAQPPAISIEYDERADEECARRRNYDIEPAWAEEMRSRLPEFRALWEAKGPSMLAAVAVLTGRPLRIDQQTVHLTLCDLPSRSFLGTSVNMRYALRSFAAVPVPLRVKVDTVFHELLHGFVSQHTPEDSPQLSLHKGESSCVRNHLHLLALQKAVLLSLGESRELAQLIAVDERLPSGCYKRAWSLINGADDTFKRYVAELAN